MKAFEKEMMESWKVYCLEKRRNEAILRNLERSLKFLKVVKKDLLNFKEFLEKVKNRDDLSEEYREIMKLSKWIQDSMNDKASKLESLKKIQSIKLAYLNGQK